MAKTRPPRRSILGETARRRASASSARARPLPGGKPLPTRMTFRQFLAWTDEDTWAEWVRGEVILMAPARVRHQAIAGFLNALLQHWVEAHALGAVYPAPH